MLAFRLTGQGGREGKGGERNEEDRGLCLGRPRPDN